MFHHTYKHIKASRESSLLPLGVPIRLFQVSRKQTLSPEFKCGTGLLKATNAKIVLGLYRDTSLNTSKTLRSEMGFSVPVPSKSLYGSSFHLSVPVGLTELMMYAIR